MKTKSNMIIAMCCLSSLLMLSASASAQEEKIDASAWTAKEVSKETMEKVINGNLFVPSQRRAPRVEPAPGEAGQEQPEQQYEPQPEPEDPDRAYRFIGVSYTGERWLAFFENMQTREVFRVGEDETFASGKLGAISHDVVEYQVGDEQRNIQIGYDLTGALASRSYGSGMSGYYGSSDGYGSSTSERGSDNSTTSSNESSDTGSSTADILRRLRERRERESQ